MSTHDFVHESINCIEAVEFVSLLRDNDLDAINQLKLKAHTLNCLSCDIASKQFNILEDGLDELLVRLDFASPLEAI